MAQRTFKYLLGIEYEMWVWKEDNPTTQSQLMAHAEETIGRLKSIDPKTLEGMGSKIVELPLGKTMGENYILGFAVPSIFFHLSTAYGILRMKGVPLGKRDYLEPLDLYPGSE